MFHRLSIQFSILAITSLLSINTIAQQFTPDVNAFIKTKDSAYALIHAKVIDGTGGPAKDNQTVLVSNGIITATGDDKRISIPKGITIINCSGKTLIPGLVMLHEHLYYTMFMDRYFNVQEMSSTFAKMYLAGGATTIRTAGSIEPQTDLAIQRMIGEGKLIGPDMDVTAPYIERKGFDIPALNNVKDSAESSASVTFWANKGCTSFKMYMHAIREDFIAVIREAHKRGLKVTGHLCAVTYREAANMGIDNLEHGFMASSDFDSTKKPDQFNYPLAYQALLNLDVNSPKMKSLINLLIQKKVALTSTLPVFEPYTDREIILGGGDSALVPQVMDIVSKRWKNGQHKDSAAVALFKKEMTWEKQFYDQGGVLLAGTDPTGSGRTLAGYGSRRELELLVDAGFTPVQVIKICTLNGAKFLNKEKQIGTIETGKQADMVLISGDLEANIKNIRNVDQVFKKGTGFDARMILASVNGKVGLN